MKSKIVLFGLVVILGLFLTSLVSAALLTLEAVTVPTSVPHDGGTFNIVFKMTNTGAAATVSFSDSEITVGTATINPIPNVAIGDGVDGPQTLNNLVATVTYPAGQTGKIEGKIVATPSGSGNPAVAVLPFSVNLTGGTGLTVTKKKELTTNQDGEVEVKNTGTSTLTGVTLSSTGDFSVAFNPADAFNLNVGETKLVKLSSSDLTDLDFGSNAISVTATGTDNTSSQVTSNSVTFSVDGSFCTAGEKGGNLVINDITIDNLGEGSDDEWQLLDELEVEIDVENDGDVDLEDIFVELALFDSQGKNIIDDLDFDSADEEEYDLGDLDEGDEETVTFKFRVAADVEDGNHKLVVKAYSDDSGERNECTDKIDGSNFENVDIERETDEGKFITFEDVVITPNELSCGDTVTLSTNVFNIGDEDQDQVRVNLDNVELNIRESYEIRNDLDQGDKEKVSFDFTVPQTAKKGSYQLRLSADYDYRSGTYRESSEEDAVVLLNVVDCGGVVPPQQGGDRIAAINAVLDSEAKAGQELAVKATITNLMSERASFVISADGFQSWASLSDISERILDLDAGQSKEVVFKFNVNDDATGEQSFKVEVISEGAEESREIAVNIGEGSTTGIPSFDLGNNTYLWIIGIINVILIVLIIIVAVRISRR